MAHVLQILSTGNGTKGTSSIDIRVHWLYRPASDTHAPSTDCAPFRAIQAGELFYSFHEDVLPLDSVLQNIVVYCLSPGQPFRKRGLRRVPGYFCKRVYSRENKHHVTHWIADKDYSSRNQKIVNALLAQTRLNQERGILMKLDDPEDERPTGKIVETPPTNKRGDDRGKDRDGADAVPGPRPGSSPSSTSQLQAKVVPSCRGQRESTALAQAHASHDTIAEVKHLQKKIASLLNRVTTEPSTENVENLSDTMPSLALKLHGCMQLEGVPFFLSSVMKIAQSIRQLSNHQIKITVARSMLPTLLGEWAQALVDALESSNGLRAFVCCCEALMVLPIKLLPEDNQKIGILHARLKDLSVDPAQQIIQELAKRMLQKSFR